MAIQQDSYLLLYDEISNGPKGKFYRFRLSGLPDDVVIKAVMLNELALSGGNQFSSTLALKKDVPIANAVEKVRDVVRPGVTLAGGAGYTATDTTEVWEQSNKPKFSIEFLLLAHNAAKAIEHVSWIKKIHSTVLPRSGSDGGLLPPNGYTNKGGGTLSLSVGTWFSANKLIMEDVAYTPSKQVMSNGYPLYWNCRITLAPFRTITIGEFEAYFQSVNTMSPDQVAAVKKEDPNFFERFVAKTNEITKKVTG